MATPLERVRAAWSTGDRLALHREVEQLAAEGHTRQNLEDALEELLKEVRAAGADDDTEEIINGVWDRLTGWCDASRQIKTRYPLPAEEQIAQLPRHACIAFAARCARRVLSLFRGDEASIPTRFTVLNQALLTAERAGSEKVFPTHELVAANRSALNALQPSSQLGPAALNAGLAVVNAVATAINARPTTAKATMDAAVAAASQDGFDIRAMLAQDFQNALRTTQTEDWIEREGGWVNAVPFEPELFGPMWPDNPPPGWPITVALKGNSVQASAGSLGVDVKKSEPLIDVYFAEGEFSAGDMQLFLDYLAATYRDLDGAGLKVVEQHTEVYEGAEVPQ